MLQRASGVYKVPCWFLAPEMILLFGPGSWPLAFRLHWGRAHVRKAGGSRGPACGRAGAQVDFRGRACQLAEAAGAAGKQLGRQEWLAEH
jgi:hypothetical protein